MRSASAKRNAAFSAAHGLTVMRGPACGLRYPDAFAGSIHDLVPKLVGTYECELHEPLSAWVESRPRRFIDIGAAEGYFAVGIARAVPAIHVIAFEMDPVAQERLREMATVNGVVDRIDIRAEATTGELAALDARGAVVLCDCEGGEMDLLDPYAVPWLREVPIIVELHDFLDDRITPTLFDRFAGSHAITVVDEVTRDPGAESALDALPPRLRVGALDERRPTAMRWAVMWPNA